MKKFMHILMLSCKKATELIDKSIHSGISRKETVQLHLHTMMCNACRNYEKQSYFIDSALKQSETNHSVDHHDDADPAEGLLERIIQKLKEK